MAFDFDKYTSRHDPCIDVILDFNPYKYFMSTS